VPREYTPILNADACRAVLTRYLHATDPFARYLRRKRWDSPSLAFLTVAVAPRHHWAQPCANPAAQVTVGTCASIWRFWGAPRRPSSIALFVGTAHLGNLSGSFRMREQVENFPLDSIGADAKKCIAGCRISRPSVAIDVAA